MCDTKLLRIALTSWHNAGVGMHISPQWAPTNGSESGREEVSTNGNLVHMCITSTLAAVCSHTALLTLEWVDLHCESFGARSPYYVKIIAYAIYSYIQLTWILSQFRCNILDYFNFVLLFKLLTRSMHCKGSLVANRLYSLIPRLCLLFYYCAYERKGGLWHMSHALKQREWGDCADEASRRIYALQQVNSM